MLDIHTHILPGIDDGAASVDESVKMLNLLSMQGVDRAVATPHFYPTHICAEEFLEKRQRAIESLKPSLEPSHPELIFGAEIKYYEGISRLRELRELSFGEKRALLIEMNGNAWNDYSVRELIDLSCSYTVILAHIERFIDLQKKQTIVSLLENDILMQSNAEFFLGLTSRRRAIKLLKGGKLHFLGSDCHNLSSRPPNIGDAAQIIKSKLNSEFFAEMVEFSNQII